MISSEIVSQYSIYVKLIPHILITLQTRIYFTCNELMTPLAMLDNLPATFVTPSRTPSLMSYKLGAT